ncbi:MAG: hypothetical protein HRU19_00540 [Pseudobacteriovorax sp.]|nr:hypothetical protein [Pseudobacteriovorax sp.]
MNNKDEMKRSFKKAILKLKNGSASSEQIAKEFADAVELFVKSENLEKMPKSS